MQGKVQLGNSLPTFAVHEMTLNHLVDMLTRSNATNSDVGFDTSGPHRKGVHVPVSINPTSVKVCRSSKSPLPPPATLAGPSIVHRPPFAPT